MAQGTKEHLIHGLKSDADGLFSGGRINNITDIVFTIAAIVSSILAALCTLLPHNERYAWLVAMAAALPAALVSVQTKVEFRARSNWYFQKAAYLRDLAVRLEFDNSANLEDFAGERGRLEVEMEKSWARIGQTLERSETAKS